MCRKSGLGSCARNDFVIKYFSEKKIQKMIYVLSSQRFAKKSLSVLSAGSLRAAGQKAKMEAGANPARSRHCKGRVVFSMSLEYAAVSALWEDEN